MDSGEKWGRVAEIGRDYSGASLSLQISGMIAGEKHLQCRTAATVIVTAVCYLVQAANTAVDQE